MAPETEVSVLGPVAVTRSGAPVDLGAPKQRALVAALALTPGRPVSVDALVDALWGEDPPPGVTGTLQAYVSGLRRSLEPDRQRRAAATVLVTVAPGYALDLPHEAFDVCRLERLVTAEHRRLSGPLLGPSRWSSEELAAAVCRLDEALALWRGEPYAELPDVPAAVAERGRLEELRLIGLEARAAARSALGDHATAAAELAALTAAHPLRERLWGLRALALVRSGRQAEALDVLRRLRDQLADELGLDPGPELRALEEQVLRQDPALTWAPPLPAPPGEADQAEAPVVVGAGREGSPFVGRDAELARLQEALAAARDRTGFAVVTGEPGIGKSRLCDELVATARRLGATAVVGRCSQDEGAPPLWPWTTVLGELGARIPAAGSREGGDFRHWEEVTGLLREAAGRVPGPLLLVLDDLHWADSATLRVLRLLAETTRDVPLLLVATWRDRPRPTGALADVAETLARRHATRLELTGLDAPAVAGIVGAVTHQRPSDAQAARLLDRTDGNPFFLVEYALLAGVRGGLAGLLADDDPPTAVQEVLQRRLDRLPAATPATLQAAAVLGRSFDVAAVAALVHEDEEDLLDVVEPAQAAGLVHEEGVGRFAFAHALVRDTLYAALSPTRRARQHARAAEHAAAAGSSPSEVARHWLAAGPARAAEAWRAASVAAGAALESYANQEAVDLFGSALAAVREDPAATPRDRYHVLLGLAGAYRRAVMWPELVATVEEAVATAEELGDPVLAAEAAVTTAHGALWQSAAQGTVHEGIVAALRRSLAALPAGDSPLRCRCLLGLAQELYYASGFAERRALVDSGLAMARRLGDPRLLLEACQTGFSSLWEPSTAQERMTLIEEAVALARVLGDETAQVTTATLQAVVLAELGRPREMWEVYERARAQAARVRHVYALLVLDSMVISWRALQGRFDECDRLLGEVRTLTSRASLLHLADATRGNLLTMAMWRGLPATDEAVADLESSAFRVTATIGVYLWRGGREADARRYVTEHGVDLAPDGWFSMLNWCHAGAMAAVTGDARLGVEAYDRLAPYAGRSASAGSGVASGPVDAYLALAAAGAGDRDLGRRHAADAARLAEEWQVPLFARWWGEQRDRFGL